MKRHLEPLAIAANVTEAAFCRLDTVLLTFGFLVMRYERMSDEGDRIASRSIISSLEKRWMAANQDIFIAAVIVNPFFRAAPFGRHPRFVVAGIIEFLGRLYLQFFQEVAPQTFGAEMRDYLTEEGQYTELRATCHRHKISAKQYVRSLFCLSPAPKLTNLQEIQPDPLEVYRDLSFSSEPHTPFRRLAVRLLSVCTNSATCERLFSVFGNVLTKTRNRLGTSTLRSIAELKMHVRNEHWLNSTKSRMKRMFSTRSKSAPHGEPTTPFTPTQPLDSRPTPSTSDDDIPPSIDRDTSHTGFRDFIATMPTNDSDIPAHDSPGVKMSLSELFNFENSHWTDLYEECASRSFEAELALYDLLNEDAAAGEGAEVEVDETTADILLN